MVCYRVHTGTGVRLGTFSRLREKIVQSVDRRICLRAVPHQGERDLDGDVATDAADDEPHFDVVRDVNSEEMAFVGCVLERRRRQSCR